MRLEGEGILLRARPCGERGAVWTILCRQHGKICGYAEKNRRMAAQPGYVLHYSWHARTDEQLGRFSLAIHDAKTAAAYTPVALYAMRALPALADKALAERDPCPDSYDALARFFIGVASAPADDIGHIYRYLHAEAVMLRAMGYGLSGEKCAFGDCENPPAYISPRTGAAACLTCGAPFRGKIFSLSAAGFSLFTDSPAPPQNFTPEDASRAADILAFFWNRSVFDEKLGAALPERALFLRKATEKS